MTPGNRHRRARMQNGLSLRELEARTQERGHRVSRSTISRIERDKHNPTILQTQALCAALSMSADWWFLGDKQPAYAIGKRTVDLPARARALILNTIDALREILPFTPKPDSIPQKTTKER